MLCVIGRDGNQRKRLMVPGSIKDLRPATMQLFHAPDGEVGNLLSKHYYAMATRVFHLKCGFDEKAAEILTL